MPTYKVTDPNTGATLKLTGDSPPSGAELEQIFASQTAFEEMPAAPEETSMADIGTAAVGGANLLAPALLGLPVDVAQNIANLGVAGYGTVRKEIGKLAGEEGYIPPELLPAQPGGSEWMRQKMTAGAQALGGGDPFAAPNIQDPLQQKAQMAGTILATGAMAPATGMKQAAANIARMAVPAAGAIGMKEAFPEEPLAPMLGMMAAPIATQTAMKAVAPGDVSKAFMKAHQLGYKVPPAMAKGTKTQQFIEGSAGPVPTKQRASVYNQQVTNDLVKKDLGYPKDVPLTREGLNSIRAEAGQVYEQAKQLGTIKTDPKFIKDVGKIANQGSALAKEFPGMVKQDVVKLAKTFGKKQVSSEALVEAVKQLRADSAAGFRSSDPATLALAKANGKMANALESLMERAAKTTAPELVPALKSARQKIAKTYTIEKVLKGENVDAVALGRQLDKGKPLSGIMRDVAEFGQAFKGAAQTNVPQQPNFRPMDLMTGAGAFGVTGNPGWLAAMGARPALRATTLSKPYQALLAKAPPAQLNQIMKLPKESQAAAIATMIEEIQRSGNADSM